MSSLEDYVTAIPDFPHKGIIFRDITTIIQDPDIYQAQGPDIITGTGLPEAVR